MTISVTVDGQGKLVAISVNRTWRRELTAEDFAGALFASYLSAVQERLVDQVSSRLDERPRGRAVSRPNAEEDLLVEGRAAVEESRKALLALKNAVGGEADTTEIRGARGYLTLRTRGGGAVGLVGNVPAIDKANAELLAQDAMDVFRRANLTVS